jgi:TPP-dependent 2-oxoacid decarboxylase
MGDTVSDFLLKRLSQWGVKRIFGYPGAGINGILGGLERNQELFEFVQVRHEEIAAFMATAHAKFTDEVGVCLATSGPGAIHLLNGLYDAKIDHRPVLAMEYSTILHSFKTSGIDDEADVHTYHGDKSYENNSYMHDDMQKRSIRLPIPQQRV